MKNLTKLFVIAGVLVASQSFAQFRGVTPAGSNWYLTDVDVQTGTTVTTPTNIGATYTKNTFIDFAEANQFAYATHDAGNRTSTIHIRNNGMGHFESIRQYQHVLSLDLFEKKKKLVYLATSFVPNYYDFLSEDISINILDITTNQATKVTLPTFAIHVPSLPFLGKQSRVDNRNFTQNYDFAISIPTAHTGLNEFMFVAKDIPGFNRLVRMNMNTHKLTTLRVDADVIALEYCAKEDVLKALLVEKNEVLGETKYFLANLDPKTGEFSDNKLIETRNSVAKAETEGTLQYDESSNNVVVNLNANAAWKIYTADAESNDLIEVQSLERRVDYSIAQSGPEAQQIFNLGLNVNVYPNPTTGAVRIQTQKSMVVDHITVMDANGKIIRNIAVQSGTMFNEFDLGDVEQGMYFVRVHSGTQTHTERLVKY